MSGHMPATIKICQTPFTVSLGVCTDSGSFDTNTTPNITVDKRAPELLQRTILAHELGHAAAWLFGLEERGEQFADAFAQILLSIIRDNPKLVAWLRTEQIHPVIGGETT